jgi:hypothetical protein
LRQTLLTLLPALGLAGTLLATAPPPEQPQPFFTTDGPVTEGWLTRDWTDVSKPPKWPVLWEVKEGILHGTSRFSTGSTGDKWIGTWLLTEREYSDFVLELEFRFKNGGRFGNGGIALRAPLHGDPAYEGLELQITDPRYEYSYFPKATAAQMTGALYLVRAPDAQVYRAQEWNRYRIEMRGPLLRARLNEVVIHDLDLDTLTGPALRHGEGEELLPATPGARRPRRGHLGFQDLSENGEVLMFRNVSIVALDPDPGRQHVP